ncbi:MAG: phage replisome organizer N-terminal domain-containing protein [Oscillospiraceae bacterium]
MADKRFYWLKLKEDFFENETINWLEEQENGTYYVIFYMKLCLKSLKNDGVLIRKVGNMLIPYDEKKLAEITNMDFDTVVVAMELLTKIGLIEKSQSGEIILTEVKSMIGSENTSAERKRKSRALQVSHQDNMTNSQIECDIVTTKSQNDCDETSKNVTTEYRDKSIEYRDKKIEKENIDYQRIVDMYNDTCVSFPKLKTLSESRKKSIKARFKTGYSYEDFQTLFTKAENSSFLKGSNNRDWSATFDWLIKDSNMAKVLDGNYENKKNNQPNGNGNINQSCGYDNSFQQVGEFKF